VAKVFSKHESTAPVPAFSEANPGRGTTVRIAFSNGVRTWQEEFDTLPILADVLKLRSINFRRDSESLELGNGFLARPQFVELQPQPDGSVRTTTTLELNHLVLCPLGTFEYQHSIGSTAENSVRKGFEDWATYDLPVFRDALREKPEDCLGFELGLRSTPTPTGAKRRILLGPPTYVVARPPEKEEAHPFCPCCIFRACFEAFREKMEQDAFYGVRFFALRNEAGAAQADCRVNGIDWPAGAAALLDYVRTWPDRGFEYRKQFGAFLTVRDVGTDN
jgi:hypothetical protein